jgi:predicted dehydrogenase
VIVPGFRDIRGYQAMYRDFHRSIREGRSPAMNLEVAMEDQRLMDRIYASLKGTGPLAVAR